MTGGVLTKDFLNHGGIEAEGNAATAALVSDAAQGALITAAPPTTGLKGGPSTPKC